MKMPVVKTAVLPYSVIDHSEWSVTALFAEKELGELQGIPLDDIVEFNPVSINSDDINSDEEYRYLDLSCLSPTTGLITEYKVVEGSQLPARARLKVKEGDILLSTVRPERNLVAIVTEEYEGCIANTTFAVLRPKKTTSEILYFILRSPKINELLNAQAKGTSIPTLKLKDLKKIKIPVNNVDQEIGDKAKNLYLNWLSQNQSVRTIQEIVEEKFLKYKFISKSTSNETKSNISVLPYEKLQDRLDVSFYMDKPEQNWLVPVKPLANLANEFQSGITIPSKEYQDDGVAYIRIQDMKPMSISKEKLVFVDEKYREDKNTLYSGDILISRVGTIGKSTLVTEDTAGALANQHISIVRVNKEVLSPEFLSLFLNTHWAIDQLEQKAGGTAQKFIKLKDIKELIVPMPPMHIQQEITESVKSELENMDTSALENEIATLTELLV